MQIFTDRSFCRRVRDGFVNRFLPIQQQRTATLAVNLSFAHFQNQVAAIHPRYTLLDLVSFRGGYTP